MGTHPLSSIVETTCLKALVPRDQPPWASVSSSVQPHRFNDQLPTDIDWVPSWYQARHCPCLVCGRGSASEKTGLMKRAEPVPKVSLKILYAAHSQPGSFSRGILSLSNTHAHTHTLLSYLHPHSGLVEGSSRIWSPPGPEASPSAEFQTHWQISSYWGGIEAMKKADICIKDDNPPFVIRHGSPGISYPSLWSREMEKLDMAVRKLQAGK